MFLLRLESLASKSVFVTKFFYANLAPNYFEATLLTSGVEMYLSCLLSVVFFLNSLSFML